MQIRAVPRVYSSLRLPAAMAAETSNTSSASFHNGRRCALFYYRIRPWEASASTVVLPVAAVTAANYVTWCSPCGRISIIGLGPWAGGGVAQYAILAES
jgi:hypothetical protein